MKSLSVILFLILIINLVPQKKDKYKFVPDWAKEVIWYQIFPERFNNGDESNDPKPIDMEGAWPYMVPEGWRNHPWTSDWYKLQPWEQNTGQNFYWNAGLRRYGGDIQGIIDKLNYLKELGITAIYLNPVFESPSLHKYDATMYHHIDNNFGPYPEKDRELWGKENPGNPETWQWTTADILFLKLIEETHKRGMKIILDGVFNHVGRTFWAFQDIVQNQQNSNYKDWFIINSFDDPATDKDEFDYDGWYGVKDLPEIREDENGIVEGPAEHIHNVVKRWMDPNNDGNPEDGIDGWRLDVAEMVKIKFWEKFRKWVRDINPDAYLTGEVWWDNWNDNEMYNAAPWLGNKFDAVMNYRFAQAVNKFIIDDKTQITASAFADSIQSFHKDYPKNNVYVLMNLMDSHDVDRYSSQIINNDRWYDHWANPQQNEDYEVRAPNKIERVKQKLIIGIQMTMPGAPMIYYGDEAGMWGADDPDCRKPMVWQNKIYEPETHHPFGKERPIDSVSYNYNIYNWYKKLNSIRNENKALSLGNLKFIYTNNDKKIVGYLRELYNVKIFVFVNNKNEKDEIYFESENKDSFFNLISNKYKEVKDGKIKITFEPYEIVILN